MWRSAGDPEIAIGHLGRQPGYQGIDLAQRQGANQLLTIEAGMLQAAMKWKLGSPEMARANSIHEQIELVRIVVFSFNR